MLTFFATILLSLPALQTEPGPWPDRRIPVAIITGQDQDHDWQWAAPVLRDLLSKSGKFDVVVSVYPASDLVQYDLSPYRAFVLAYDGPRWGEQAEERFLEAVRDGAGVVALADACRAFPEWKAYRNLLGLVAEPGTERFPLHRFDFSVQDETHPITRELGDLKGHMDELFPALTQREGKEAHVLATAIADANLGGSGEPVPVLAVKKEGDARVVDLPLGHVTWDQRTRNTLLDSAFQRLLIRSVEWAATGEVTPLDNVLPNTLTPADRAAGWILLFDGASASGWEAMGGKGLPPGRWKVENGSLRVVPGESDVVLSQAFDEFELELEWRVEAHDGGGGMYYRIGPDGSMVWRSDLDFAPPSDDPTEAESTADAAASSAAQEGFQPAEGRILRPVGEFNHARVVARRDHVEHWLNGIKLLDLDMSSAQWAEQVRGEHIREFDELEELPLGRVVLEDRGHDVWYRNFKIRRIPGPSAPQPGAAAPAAVDLLADHSLSGWREFWRVDQGIPDVWSFDGEGNFVCKGQPIGYLATLADYEDFELSLDWRYNPVTRQAGFGGVFLRVSGPDTIWPRSLEVRIGPYETGDVWRHFEFPWRPDRTRSDARTCRKLTEDESPFGEWNRLLIQVEGDLLRVWQNGTLVNEVPGIERLAGPIAIPSNGTEVHYRNALLTPLGY